MADIVKHDQNTSLADIFGEGANLQERPDFIPEGDKTGTEGITKEDFRLPRLGIAQGLSPQMIPGDSAYIQGLGLFQMFNDSTKQIYGNGPIFFIPVRRDVKGIEFGPDGKTVIDMNVPRNDPRITKFRTGEGGKRLPPPATLFNEWIVLLLKADGTTDPVVISVKMTNKHNRRAAADLNGFIKAHASKGEKSVPIYGVIYSISSRSEKNDKGTFGVPVFQQVGYIPKNKPELFARAAAYAKDLETKEVVVAREAGDETPADATVEGEVVEGKGDKVPF